jgi:hypothetical protein
MKWHQQTHQRLPDEEQAYSLRWQGCRSKQMDMLEWLAEGRNIGANSAKITRMTTWPSKSGGVTMKDTSEAMKHWKLLTQGSRHNAKSHTETTGKGKSHQQTQDCVSTTERLTKITAGEPMLTCLNLERPVRPGEDTSAYSAGITLFQREGTDRKEARTASLLTAEEQGKVMTTRKGKDLTVAIRPCLWVHSPERPLQEMIIWAVCADLQSHRCPQRTDTRVTWDVTILENHYDRAGCPLRMKNCDALVEWSRHDQGKENKAVLDEQNHGRKEHPEGRKDPYNMKNMETPHTQQCLRNATATLTADLLCGTDSLPESKQPCGNTEEGETGAANIQFTLRDQHQPAIYGWHGENITGNQAAPLIIYLFVHIVTLHERMTAHCSADLLAPQPDNLQWKTNPGRVPIAPLHTHHSRL